MVPRIPIPAGLEDDRLQRRLALTISIVFAVLALTTPWIPGVSEGPSRWVSGMFGKLAIVVGAIWLAFPQIQRLRRLPFGSTIFGGGLAAIGVFLVRPKALLYFLPVIIAVVIAMILLGWFSKRKT